MSQNEVCVDGDGTVASATRGQVGPLRHLIGVENLTT